MDATAEQGGTSGRPVTTSARRYSARRRARLLYGRSSWSVVVLVLTFVPVSAVEAGHDPVPALIGSCTFTLTLSRTPAVPIVTDPTAATVTWTVNASGPCTDNHTSGTSGSIAGTVNRLPMTVAGCAGGVFDGNLNVLVIGSDGPQTHSVKLVLAGIALTLVGTGPLNLVGAGLFANATFTSLTALTVPVPSTVAYDVLECATNMSNGSMTYTGVYVFARPDPP